MRRVISESPSRMPEKVTFESDGLKLAGTVEIPETGSSAPRPAFLVLHGFGSNMSAGNVVDTCNMLGELGYATLRFDMRGCGESEGERGRLICLEQVSDTRSALAFLQRQPSIDPGRIGVIGSSFGAAVGLYTAGVDKRLAAVIASGGWANGERKFRGQHASPEAWERFTKMLAEGRTHRQRTGKPMLVDRYEIVPIPDHLRHNLAQRSILQFDVDTAQSMFDFNPQEVVGRIAPRPLLLLHSSVDSVTPTDGSLELFHAAGKPKDLHLFNETNHFMFAEANRRVRNVVRDWLSAYFPVETG
jgi:uncharacterized protein